MASEGSTDVRRASRWRLRPGRRWIAYLAAAGCGALLVAAFPPLGWWWLAPPAVAGFSLAAHAGTAVARGTGKRRPATSGAWAGLWFGLAFCVTMFHWVTSVGVDAWLILGVWEALYFVPLGAALATVGRLRTGPLWQALLWVAAEAVRDRFPLGGFSWGRLAFSQTHTPFTPLAALGGAPLVTFATALFGTALAALLLGVHRAVRGRPAAGLWPGAVWLLTAAAVAAASWLVPLQTTAERPVQLAAIQGNVPRTGLDAYGQMSAVLDDHVAVTYQYAAMVAAGRLPAPAAVIWPEDSDDVDPFQNPGAYAKLTRAAAAVRTQILVGAVVEVGADKARNEGVVWDPVTGPGAVYAKRHLVPLGEYIPLRSLLTPYFSELSRVPRDDIPGTRPGALTVGGVRIADVICFEVAYDGIVRDSVRGAGGVIVVQTNNATYGWTGQPEQQMAISRLRAVEHGRPVLIAATSGISGYITPDGAVGRQTGQFVPAVVTADVTPRTGLTLADRVGAWPELAMTGLGLAAWLLAAFGGRRAARRKGSAESGTLAAAERIPAPASDDKPPPLLGAGLDVASVFTPRADPARHAEPLPKRQPPPARKART